MRFLSEIDSLTFITNKLNNIEAGDVVINGRLEGYSKKQQTDEKKQFKEMEHIFKEMADEGYEMDSSIPNIGSFNPSSSPIGSLQEASTRKTLIELIQTMNASYPDYDFSSIKPEHFSREDLFMVMNNINSRLSELREAREGNFLQEFWGALEDAIHVSQPQCEVYSYIPDLEGDPFSDNCLWSCNFFFVNKSMKRIVYFSCTAKSKYQPFEMPMDYDSDSEDTNEMNVNFWGQRDSY